MSLAFPIYQKHSFSNIMSYPPSGGNPHFLGLSTTAPTFVGNNAAPSKANKMGYSPMAPLSPLSAPFDVPVSSVALSMALQNAGLGLLQNLQGINGQGINGIHNLNDLLQNMLPPNGVPQAIRATTASPQHSATSCDVNDESAEDSMAAGKRKVPFGRRSGDAAQLRRQARQKERRQQVGQLWSLLDAMLPCTEPPRNRRGGVVSQSLNSGRSKDELLVKLLEVAKGTAPANTVIVPNKDYKELAFCSGAGLVALDLASFEVAHASQALDDAADWLYPGGLAGSSLLPLLHHEDADAFEAFTRDALRDFAAGGDGAVAGRSINIRLLKRYPGGSPSVRGPEWLLVYTTPKKFTLTSVGAGGVGVFVADLKREKEMGVAAECVRNIIDSKMLNIGYDLAEQSIADLPPWSGMGGAAVGGQETFHFQLTGGDELRMQRRTSFAGDRAASSLHTCWFGRAEVSSEARTAPRGRSSSGSFGSAEFDGASRSTSCKGDIMFMVVNPASTLSCELQAIQLSRPARGSSSAPSSPSDMDDLSVPALREAPLVTTLWSWSIASLKAKVCSGAAPCVEVLGKAIPRVESLVPSSGR
ncbi:hypothetical protein T484DRAFT_1949971 [Baffinella frigidus]|nr:hypothetical protein T484DRAFT_1949971 [Cryptophyta sp. CCMP2293]